MIAFMCHHHADERTEEHAAIMNFDTSENKPASLTCPIKKEAVKPPVGCQVWFGKVYTL